MFAGKYFVARKLNKKKETIILYLQLIFSWCEKKNVPSTVIPTKNQRRTTTATTTQSNISTMTPMKSINLYSGSKLSTSNDLASKIQPIRR